MRKLFRLANSVLPLAAILLCAAAIQGSALTLIEQGKPRATIVVAAGAGEKTRFAAEELRKYLAAMTGATLPGYRYRGSCRITEPGRSKKVRRSN